MLQFQHIHFDNPIKFTNQKTADWLHQDPTHMYLPQTWASLSFTLAARPSEARSTMVVCIAFGSRGPQGIHISPCSVLTSLKCIASWVLRTGSNNTSFTCKCPDFWSTLMKLQLIECKQQWNIHQTSNQSLKPSKHANSAVHADVPWQDFRKQLQRIGIFLIRILLHLMRKFRYM